jgi:Elongation factor SelB, winged helix
MEYRFEFAAQARAEAEAAYEWIARQSPTRAAALADTSLPETWSEPAVPLLEYLDASRVTRRVGDERILF